LQKIGVKKFIPIIIFSLVISILSFPRFAYAGGHQELYIHGEHSRGGPIFHGSGSFGCLWAPGVEDSGTITIHNNYSQRIRVSNLALTMSVQKGNGEAYRATNDQELLETFARNMELTIKRKVAGIFNDTIFKGTFWDLLYEKNNPNKQGYNLPLLDKFNIGKGDTISLQYTVKMKESAGNELQGVKATVSFLINAHENPDVIPPDDGGDDNGGGDNGSPNDYSDHWAHDCIRTLLKHNVLKPYDDGTIRPDNYITRAEMAELVCRALGIEENNKLFSGYLDPLPKRERGFIIAGTEAGIFVGYPGKIFLPNRNISRQEMVVALVKAFNLNVDGEVELNFTDKDQIVDWALEYVKIAVYHQVVVGYPDNTFRPEANMTRAETFTIICKLLGLHSEHS